MIPEKAPSPRWLALRLLEDDKELCEGIDQMLGFSLAQKPDVARALPVAKQILNQAQITQQALCDVIVRP